jgi:MFS transporter, DHA2 family, multidrug resistance protein
VTAAGPGQIEHPHVNPWLTAIAVMFGTFMVVLDTTVVNVSLPQIAGSLGATVDEATWALTSYLVANAVVLPLTGWLATVFGRKRLLMLAVAGFTSASLLCGVAPSLAILIVFRVLQGATGAVMQPLSQAVLLEAFEPKDRGKAMGFWGLGVVAAPILGPVLGGWLTDNYSWRWVFYINVPVGVAGIVMTRLFVFDPSYLRRRSDVVDYLGIGLLALGISTLQIALDKGQQEDWLESRFIVLMLVTATSTIGAFIWRELTTEHPVVDLRVFRIPTYTLGVAITAVLGFVLYGSLVLLPVMLQTLMGYPPLQAGIAMAPRGMGSFIAMPLVGIATQHFDGRKLVGFGLLLGAFTCLWLSWLNLAAGYWDLFWPQFLQGFALGLLFVPLTTITMAPIAREAMGNATSLFNLLRNQAGGIGIAFVTAMLARRRAYHTAVLATHVTGYGGASGNYVDALRGGFMARGADAVTAAQRAYAAVNGMIARQAAALSFIDLFWLLAVFFVAAVPLLFFMRRPEHVEVAMAGE